MTGRKDADVRVTALIADDEPVARAGLRDMLAPVEWVTCIGEAAKGPAATNSIDMILASGNESLS